MLTELTKLSGRDVINSLPKTKTNLSFTDPRFRIISSAWCCSCHTACEVILLLGRQPMVNNKLAGAEHVNMILRLINDYLLSVAR